MAHKIRSVLRSGLRSFEVALRWHASGRSWRNGLDVEGPALFAAGIAGFATVLLEIGLWTRSPSWFLPFLGRPAILGPLLLAAVPSGLLGALLVTRSMGSRLRKRDYASGIPLVGPLWIAWDRARADAGRSNPRVVPKDGRDIGGEEGRPTLLRRSRRAIREAVQTYPGIFVLALATIHGAQVFGGVAWWLDRANSDPRMRFLAGATAVALHGTLALGTVLALGRQRPLDPPVGARRILPWTAWLPMPWLFGHFVLWWWLHERARERTFVFAVLNGQRWKPRKAEAELPRNIQPPSRAGLESRFFRLAGLRAIAGAGETFSLSWLLFASGVVDVADCELLVRGLLVATLGATALGMVPLVPWQLGRSARWTAASLGAVGAGIGGAALGLVESASTVVYFGGLALGIAVLIVMLAIVAGTVWVPLGNEVAAGRGWVFLFGVVGGSGLLFASTHGDLSTLFVAAAAYGGWIPSAFFVLWAVRRRRSADPTWPLGLPGAFLFLPFSAAGRGGTRAQRNRR